VKRILVVLVGILFFLFGLGMVVGQWGAYNLDTGIEKHGARANGFVTKKTFLLASDGDSDYIVEYRFSLPRGQQLKGQHSVSKKLWSSLKEGESLVVLYHPENPNRNFPLGGGVRSFGVTIFVWVLGVVFLVFGGLICVGGIRRKSSDA
jgi:hypothetical protein